MTIFRNALLPLVIAGALVLGANAQGQTDHPHQKPDVKEQMVLSGHVKKVLTGENMVWIHNDYGAEVDVTMDTLGPLSRGREGWQKVEPGMDIDARMHPGVLSVQQASNGRIWILVDGEKFARVRPDEINEHLFENDRVTVRYPDGREQDNVSLADLLLEQAKEISPGR